jgi:hypothetical protein
VYAVVVPLGYRFYRRRRRRAAIEPDEQVRLAWQESVEAVQLLGVAPRRSETPTEFGRRVRRTIGTDGFPVLADLVSAADYSANGVDADEAVEANEIRDDVSATVRDRSTRQQRARAALDPRPPDRRTPGTPRRHGVTSAGELPEIEVERLPLPG